MWFSQNKTIISKQYKNIIENIQFASIEKNIKSILITSSTQNEGKSTVSYNLANEFCEINKKVLLIDCDLRNPTIHSLYNIKNDYGVVDIIKSTKRFDECIKKDVFENLDIITAGINENYSIELLSSQIMEEFIKELNNMYDYIIIDTPPIGIVYDASIISRFVDSVILVVSSGKNDEKTLRESKYRIEKNNENILGVIVNKYKDKDDMSKRYYCKN